MEDCIDRIGNAKYITKIDLLKGYWGVPLTERAKAISAFATPDGLFQYKVMPFGMKNSQATFVRLMNMCFRDISNVDSYIDDIVVYNNTWEEHLNTLEATFRQLKRANLTVNLAKSEFCQAEVKYLGHKVGHGKISPAEAKIHDIQAFPAPTNVKGLRRFLGMAGYYRKFCPDYSEIATPLTDLLKKGRRFTWNDECERAFDSIKARLSQGPVLKAPDFEKPFVLEVDASDRGIGAILLQQDESDELHPVSYYSRKLDAAQLSYSTVEKEALAMINGLQHFNIYITPSAQPTVVLTDHNPLVFVNKMKNKNRRLLSWNLILQEYNLVIKHVKGVNNQCADALSRTWQSERDEDEGGQQCEK